MAKTNRAKNAKGHKEHWLHNKPQYRTEDDVRRWWGEVFPGHEGDIQPWQLHLLTVMLNREEDGDHVVFMSGRRNGQASVRKVADHARKEIRGVHAGPAILDETTVFTEEQVAALEFLKKDPPKFPSYEESFTYPDSLWIDYTSLLRDEIMEAAEIEANRKWWDELMVRHQPAPVPIPFVRPDPDPRDVGSNIRASWNYVKHKYGSIEEYYKLNWESSMAKKNKTHTEDLSNPKPIPSVGDLATLYATEPSAAAGPRLVEDKTAPLREKLTNQKKELRRLNKAIQHLSLQDIVNRSRVKTLRALTVTQQDELARKNREIQVLRAERIAAEKYAGEQEAKRKDEKRKRKQAERSLELLKADINTP